MEVTEFGMFTLVSDLHSLKAWLPMEVTEFGMSTLVSKRHPLKAASPMDVTVSGIFTEMRFVSLTPFIVLLFIIKDPL